MSYPTSRTLDFEVRFIVPSEIDQPHQVLQVQSNIFRREITRSFNRSRQQSVPIISHNSALLPVSLQDDPIEFRFHLESLLLSLDIEAVVCEIIAEEIALNVNEITAENRDVSFHIMAIVNTTQIVWMIPVDYRELNGDGASPAKMRVKMERLKETIGEDLGVCSICLNEFNLKEREVVKIPCGHVYDEQCILRWFGKNQSCPLCRRPVPWELEDKNENNCGIQNETSDL